MSGFWGRSDSVVSLQDAMTEARFNFLNEVDAYWEGLRAGRLVPRRSEIDPRGIERALEHAFILERVAPGIARTRIAGAHLNDLMGMDIRGMPLSALATVAARRELSETLERVFDAPAKARIALRAQDGMGKPALEGRMILLPLKSDLGDVTRLLGCLVTAGRIGRAPRRFDIVSNVVTPLLGDFADPPNFTDHPRPEPTPGLAEDRTPFAPRPAAERAPQSGGTTDGPRFKPGPAPYLRVVDTDKT